MDLSFAGGRTAANPLRSPVALVSLLLVVVALAGGTARPDSLGQVVVRVACALALAGWALLRPAPAIGRLRTGFFFVAAVALVAALQLVPLPPSVWTALPGRDFYAASSAAAGMPLPWRPVAVVPSRAASALFVLLVPLAVLVGLARCTSRQRVGLLIVVVALAFASAVLGLAQLSQGEGSPLRWYWVTNTKSAVGFLANRNHQALLLAAALPALAAWACTPGLRRDRKRVRAGAAVATAAFFVLMLPTTGSRAGIVLMAVSLLGAVAIILPDLRGALGAMRPSRRRRALGAAAAALVAFGAVVVFFGRNEAFVRLRDLDPTGDLRLRVLPIVIEMLRRFFPIGAGLGSFETVYRQFEPLERLSTTYLNQAHNDLLQVVVEAGLVGGLLLAAFVLWWVAASWRAWREPRSAQAQAARAGSVVVLLTLLASLTDYPARTPLLLAVLTIACCWLLTPGPSPTEAADIAEARRGGGAEGRRSGGRRG